MCGIGNWKKAGVDGAVFFEMIRVLKPSEVALQFRGKRAGLMGTFAEIKITGLHPDFRIQIRCFVCEG